MLCRYSLFLIPLWAPKLGLQEGKEEWARLLFSVSPLADGERQHMCELFWEAPQAQLPDVGVPVPSSTLHSSAYPATYGSPTLSWCYHLFSSGQPPGCCHSKVLKPHYMLHYPVHSQDRQPGNEWMSEWYCSLWTLIFIFLSRKGTFLHYSFILKVNFYVSQNTSKSIPDMLILPIT